MWEAIRANKIRSRVLISAMGGTLIGLGALFGAVYQAETGAAVGAVFALGIWGLLVLVALAGGDKVLLMSAGAKKIEKQDAPRLWNVVEEMTIASGLGRMPDVYVIDEDAPNAFAVGQDPSHAAVAVTRGLLRRLNRDELQGVVAHEIGHIRNLDIRFMTLAAVMLGSIVLLSDVFLRSLWFGGGRRRGRGGQGGQAQMILVVVSILMAILAPLLARLLYFACSRQREFLADASAARFTRYPEGLASALEKISRPTGGKVGRKGANRALAPMYIVRPEGFRSLTGMFSTHPPMERRIGILRSMGGGAGYAEYEKAWRQTGGDGTLLDARTLQGDEPVTARQATPEPETKKDAQESVREVLDVFDRLAGFLIVGCACGVRIKVPEGYGKPTVPCTRCGRENPLPRAAEPEARSGPATYRRTSAAWESFRCPCGRNVQISPAFRGEFKKCTACNRKIRILPAK